MRIAHAKTAVLTGKYAIAGTVLAGTVLVGGTAHAASGGGCTGHPDTQPCISLSGQNLYSDFYQIAPPDSSFYRAVMTVYVNGAAKKSATYYLTRTGRYGPISTGIATMPPSKGSAYTHVAVYTSWGALHFTTNSPTQYYP